MAAPVGVGESSLLNALMAWKAFTAKRARLHFVPPFPDRCSPGPERRDHLEVLRGPSEPKKQHGVHDEKRLKTKNAGHAIGKLAIAIVTDGSEDGRFTAGVGGTTSEQKSQGRTIFGETATRPTDVC